MDNAYQVDADFIVIDFETATRSNDSACQIGIVAIKDFQIADYYELSFFRAKNLQFQGAANLVAVLVAIFQNLL